MFATFRVLAGLVLPAFLADASLPAQVLGRGFLELHSFEGNINERMGKSVAGAGDVNQDGFADVIVGASKASGGGSAFVYSGQDGSQIWRFDGEALGDDMGFSVAGAGDVNNDGFVDLIVGARWTDPGGRGDAGSAYVYSGKDGMELWQFDGETAGDQLGYSVDGAGDVNQDGFADVIVGAQIADPGGRTDAGAAYVYSGKDGAELWRFEGAVAEDFMGSSVAGAGDVNMDGFPDVIVGAQITDPGGVVNGGTVYVYSGKDGSELWRFDGAFSDQLGNAVGAAGDVNMDGYADVILGAHSASPGMVFGAGSAYIYSGKDKSLIWQFDGAADGDSLGWSVDGAGDVNGDGVPDVVVGARLANPSGMDNAGSAYIYSGMDGSVLRQFDGVAMDEEFGHSVGGAGDVNQDGLADVIVGAVFANPGGLNRAGSAFVHGFGPVVSRYGAGLAGTGGIVPVIGAGGELPLIGSSSFEIEITEAVGGAPCFIAGSLFRADMPLLGGTLHGDFLTPGAFVIFPVMSSGSAGAAGVGEATLPIQIPNDPSLLGFTTYWQGFASDGASPSPVGFSHTGGLEVVLFL